MAICSNILLQTGLNELIQILVPHLLRGGRFVVGAQVFDAAFVKRVTANLVAPTDVDFGVFEFLQRFLPFAQFKVVQPRGWPSENLEVFNPENRRFVDEY